MPADRMLQIAGRRHGLRHASAAPSSRCATSTWTSQRGEFVTLIGHSGCGKSHAAQPDRRPDHADQRRAAAATTARSRGPGPDRGVVFQNHSLLPWLSCFDNVHLAVERVFGADREQGAAAASARWPRWSWWAWAHAAAQAPARDLRRHEAARGHRPRAGDGAQGAADGRALRRARRADARQAAGRAAEDRRAHRTARW